MYRHGFKTCKSKVYCVVKTFTIYCYYSCFMLIKDSKFITTYDVIMRSEFVAMATNHNIYSEKVLSRYSGGLIYFKLMLDYV